MKYQLENSDVVLTNVHEANFCHGDTCVIHKKTDHSMRSFPQHWRDDIKMMERLCPCGVGHPDPDNAWYAESSSWVHGCCPKYCCRP